MATSSGLSCEFAGSILTEAEYRSANAVVCNAPPMFSPGGHEIRIRVRQGGGFLAGEVVFQYTKSTVVNSYGPAWGPIIGGTMITIAFQSMLGQDQFCFFGSLRVPLTLLGSSVRNQQQKYQCVSPLSDAPKLVDVGLSFNSEDVASYSVRFEYEVPVQVWSLSPSHGSSAGGSRIVVYGSGFTQRASDLAHLWCMFNQTRVMAAHISYGEISCVSPTHKEGVVALEVTNNNQQFTTNGHLFAFAAHTVVMVHPISGPVRGGTTVIVMIDYLPSATTLQCSFDGIILPASFESRERVICQTPARETSGSVHISLIAAGASIESSATFSFYQEASFRIIFPAFGPASGGTHVVIHTRSNVQAPFIWCSFGSLQSKSGTMLLPMITPGRYISPTKIVCVAPASSVTGEAVVSISRNAQDLSLATANFEFIRPVRLTSLIPSKGPIHGGTYILLRGDHLEQRWAALGLATCKFEQQRPTSLVVVAAQLLGTNQVACTTATGHVHGACSVEVSLNGLDYTSDGRVFEFIEVAIRNIMPTAGPLQGGTVVTIEGAHLGLYSALEGGTSRQGIACAWGQEDDSQSTTATRVSSTVLHCVSPAQPRVTVVDIRVRVGGAWHGEHRFRYYGLPSVASLHPVLGPAAGGTVVRLTSRQSPFNPTTVCRFGSQQVVAVRLMGSNLLSCVTPMSAQGAPFNVPVAVSTNGQQFSASDHVFRYLPELRVGTVYPRAGPTEGGSFVRVGGEGFSARSAYLAHLLCKFNVSAVLAVFVSRSEIACYSPEMHEGAAALEVTLNSQDYTSFGNVFTYLNMRALEISPSKGGAAGGTLVRLRGTPVFGDDIYCSFAFAGGGEIPVPASLLAIDVVACMTPRLPAASTVLELGPTMTASVQLVVHEARLLTLSTYTYLLPLRLEDVHPRSGPVGGGTALTLKGSWFTPQASQFCIFSRGHTPNTRVFALALMTSSTTLECHTPPFEPAYAETSISIDVAEIAGPAEYSPAAEDGGRLLSYTYHPDILVVELAPTHGPQHGGTLLQLYGRFSVSSRALSTVSCKFNSTDVPASRIDSSRIECTAPAQPQGYVSIEVSHNRIDWSSCGSIFEYIDLGVQSLRPATGPAAGHTLVTVELTRRRLTAKDLRCMFGDGMVVIASLSDEAAVTCASPELPMPLEDSVSLSVSVHVIANGAVLNLDRALFFRYEHEVDIHVLSPSTGPTAGGTYIVLYGSFPAWSQGSTSMCAFDTLAQPPLVVMAQYVSSSSVTCISPARDAGFAIIRLSTNGQDFSLSAGAFEFTESPTLLAVDPSGGPVDGGTNVIISFASANTGIAGAFRATVCRFGESLATASHLDPMSVSCFAPARTQVGAVSVEISDNWQNYVGADRGLLFRYEDARLPVALTVNVQSVQLSSIFPLSGPQEGGTTISLVSSQALGGLERLWCHFGGISVAPALLAVGMRTVTCVTPRIVTGFVDVELRPTAQLASAAQPHVALPFRVDPPLVLQSVLPRQGSPNGGTRVAVSVGDIGGSPRGLRCRFNATEVIADYAWPHVLCRTPPASSGREGFVSVFVSNNNGVDYSTPILFEYVYVRLTAIAPPFGPNKGGTRVFVQTSRILGGVYQCAFAVHATTHATATLDSANSFRCITPAREAWSESPTSLSLLADGAISSAVPLLFHFVPDVIVTSFTPAAAPIAGGTTIALSLGVADGVFASARWVSNLVRCRIGGVRLPAFWSSTSIHCTLPARSLMNIQNVSDGVAIEVALNGQQWSVPSVTRLQLVANTDSNDRSIERLMPMAAVLSIYPTIGPAASGSVIHVSGRRLHTISNDLVCAFSSPKVPVQLVRAVVVSISRAKCLTPTHLPERNVKIKMLTTAAELGTFEYTFRETPAVSRVWPSAGPASGGTSITLTGSNLDGLLFVLFNTTLLVARRVSDTELQVTAPATRSVASALVSLAGHSAEDVFSTGQVFTYHEDAICSRMVPERGPLHGGTHVRMSCRGLSLEACERRDISCKFGDEAGPATCIVGSTMIACLTPPMQATTDAAALEISQNGGKDFSGCGLMFTYTVASSGSAELSPASGPTSGGTLLFIAYPAWSSSRLSCIFHDSILISSTPASFVSSGLISCAAPKRSMPHHAALEVVADQASIVRLWFEFIVRTCPSFPASCSFVSLR